MKNKNIVIKILFIGSILLILLLLVIIFSLIKLIMPNDKDIVVKEIITQNYNINEIDDLSFDFKKANSTFGITEGEELVIVQDYKEEKFHLTYKEKDNKIFFEEDSYIMNLKKKKYTVYIPKSYLGKVTIINGFGEINLEGITNNLYINNNAGNISLKKTGNIKIKDVSGNMTFEDIEGNIIAESTTGTIKIDNMIGITNIESITGDIIINNFNVLGDSNFETVSGDIILDVTEGSLCRINASNERGKTTIDDKVCSGQLKINTLNVKNVTGLIKIY